MKTLLLLISMLSTAAFAAPNGGRLHAGYLWGASGCFQADAGFICGKELNQPMPRVASYLAAGDNHACAIFAGKVACWGQNGYGQSFSPDFGSAKIVAVGTEHSCALGSFGVRCWGNNEHGELDIPPLVNPVALYSAFYSNCAIDAGGVKCWGDLGKAAVPPLSHPRSVAMGYEHACALDDSGVKCWGKPQYLNVPALKNPMRLNVYSTQTCALDDEGVKCWKPEGTKVLPSVGQRLVFTGNLFCFFLGDHFSCPEVPVESYFVGQTFSYASLADPAFDLDDLPGYLHMIAQVSGPVRNGVLLAAARAATLTPLPAASEREVDSGRYLLTQLLAPAILGNDSSFGREKLAPAFLRSVEGFERALGFRGIESIPRTAENCRLVWSPVQAALTAAEQFFAPTERATLQAALRAVGQAAADPENAEKRLAAAAALTASAPQWDRLRGNPKSAFLAEFFLNASAWLGR